MADGLNNVCGGRTCRAEGSSVGTEDRPVTVSWEVMLIEVNSDVGVETLDDKETDIGLDVDFARAVLYSIILKTFSGVFDEVTTVATPAAVAISAAISLVSIPPVPSLDPRVAVLTSGGYELTRDLFLRSSRSPVFLISDTDSTTSIALASGSFRGLEVYRPSTSVKRNK